MQTKISDVALGGIVVALAIATVAFFLMRADDCLDQARAFVGAAPSVVAKSGKVTSVGTSSWLSGQTATLSGERSFYFLVKGERGSANAIVIADRASCTCRLESIN